MNAHIRGFVMVERRHLRERAERTIEALIAMLDDLDGDTDVEANGDELDGDFDDYAFEDDDPDEDDSDREWSLGATANIDQRVGWGAHAFGGDFEAQVDDGPIDEDERERDPAEDGIADWDGYIEQVGDAPFSVSHGGTAI